MAILCTRITRGKLLGFAVLSMAAPAAGMATTRAVWKGLVLAESSATQTVDGNTYYPHDALKMEHFSPIDQTTVCGWKVGACASLPTVAALQQLTCLAAMSLRGALTGDRVVLRPEAL